MDKLKSLVSKYNRITICLSIIVICLLLWCIIDIMMNTNITEKFDTVVYGNNIIDKDNINNIVYDNNILKNGNMEDGWNNWSNTGSWFIGNPKKDISNGWFEPYNGNNAIVSSYMLCTRTQTINLTETQTPTYLDTSPIIRVSTFVNGVIPKFFMRAELLNDSSVVIATVNIGTETDMQQVVANIWTEKIFIFINYPPGARYLKYTDGGRDNASEIGWIGYYGVAMDNSTVTIQKSLQSTIAYPMYSYPSIPSIPSIPTIPTISNPNINLLIQDMYKEYPNLSPEQITSLLNAGINVNKLSSDTTSLGNAGISLNPYDLGPSTNIYQADYKGTTNIYSPYLYYGKGTTDQVA